MIPEGTAAAAAQHRARRRRPAVGRPRRRRAARCSPGTWRCTRPWSTTSTRTSGGSSPRSRSWASSTTRSSSSCPTTARRARARQPARPRTTCTCCRATTSRPTSPASTSIGGPHDDAALPAGLGDGSATRRSGSTRSTPTPAATRCRSSSPGRRGVDDAGGELRRQYLHVTDVLPTLLELLRHRAMPTERHGRALSRSAGSELRRDAARRRRSPSTHREQYYEMNGHRGFYRDGWEVVTLHQPLTPFDDDEWELYDLRDDPTELHDLAAEHPERLAELADAWEEAAWANQVYPLDEGSGIKYLIRPPRSRGVRRAGHDRARHADARALALARSCIWFRGCRITRRARLARRRRGLSRRPRRPGRGLRAVRARRRAASSCTTTAAARCASCSGGAAPDGAPRDRRSTSRHRRARVWTVTAVRRRRRARGRSTGVPMLFGMAPFEGIDVGIDRRSPVVVGDLRALRAVPVHRRAALGALRARRARARRAGAACSTCSARWAPSSSSEDRVAHERDVKVMGSDSMPRTNAFGVRRAPRSSAHAQSSRRVDELLEHDPELESG